MTTIAALIVGLASGYYFLMTRTAFAVTTVVMIPLTALQSWHIASGDGTFSKASTVHTVDYWIFNVASIVLALALTWVGAKLANKFHSRHGNAVAMRHEHS
jgi:hypothetical protein